MKNPLEKQKLLQRIRDMDFLRLNSKLLGLAFVVVMVGVYTYSNSPPVTGKSIVTVEGILGQKPFLGQQGGDMPRNFIRLRLDSNKASFDLIDCAYNVARDSAIMALEIGTKIRASYIPTTSDSKRVDLVELSVIDGKNLLTLSDYNRCYTKKWKLMVPIALGLFTLLLYKLVGHIRNKQSPT